MTPTRYLAWVQLNSRYSRGKSDIDLEYAGSVAKAVKSVYPEAEAVLTNPHLVIFALMDSASSDDVWKKLAKAGPVRGDQVTVTELGGQITTTHDGLRQWHWRTRWLTPQHEDK
jgi:hypothetical protein